MRRLLQLGSPVFTFALLGLGCGGSDEPTATFGDASSTQSESSSTSVGSESGDSTDESGSEDTSDTGEPESRCGDGKIDAGEACDLGPLNSDNGGCTTSCTLAVCGDGHVYIGEEACDDGNSDNDDGCTILCEAPGCDDGLLSGMESDVDCGGGCLPCGVGLNCDSPDDCETWACFDGVCRHHDSCADINAQIPEAPSGRYFIDVDGDGPAAPFEVMCESELAGGGWTLVLVSSDDGQATWSWANRSWMGTNASVVGTLDEINRDFKSRAYNEMVFRDILAVHAPSGIWAQYDGVSGGSTDLGHFVAAIPSPNCDYALAGNGFEMTGGTLESNLVDNVGLCDTDLYFNLGDHDAGIDRCMTTISWSAATYGPAWSQAGNNGCPFDDPSVASLGPIIQCEACPPGTDMSEENVQGFGYSLNLNTGTPEAGENYIQLFVR